MLKTLKFFHNIAFPKNLHFSHAQHISTYLDMFRHV